MEFGQVNPFEPYEERKIETLYPYGEQVMSIGVDEYCDIMLNREKDLEKGRKELVYPHNPLMSEPKKPESKEVLPKERKNRGYSETSPSASIVEEAHLENQLSMEVPSESKKRKREDVDELEVKYGGEVSSLSSEIVTEEDFNDCIAETIIDVEIQKFAKIAVADYNNQMEVPSESKKRKIVDDDELEVSYGGEVSSLSSEIEVFRDYIFDYIFETIIDEDIRGLADKAVAHYNDQNQDKDKVELIDITNALSSPMGVYVFHIDFNAFRITKDGKKTKTFCQAVVFEYLDDRVTSFPLKFGSPEGKNWCQARRCFCDLYQDSVDDELIGSENGSININSADQSLPASIGEETIGETIGESGGGATWN